MMKKYDVFISYAVEDCQSVAAGIVKGLREKGISVYFVREMLHAGVLIEEIIHTGLEQSRYCIPVLSKSDVRTWPLVERSRMRGKEIKTGTILIFPVWHQITLEEVRVLFPEMLNRFAVSTNEGMDVVADELYKVIRKAEARRLLLLLKKIIASVAVAAAIGIMLFRILHDRTPSTPSRAVLEQLIHERIETFRVQTDHEIAQNQTQDTRQTIPLSSVIASYTAYQNGYVRNEYTFTNNCVSLSGYAHIDSLGLSIPKTPHSAYDIQQPYIWLLNMQKQDTAFLLSVAFVDTADADFSIDTCFFLNGEIHAWVSYRTPIRTVLYELDWSASDSTRHQQVKIFAFKPKEEYIIENSSGLWKIRKVI